MKSHEALSLALGILILASRPSPATELFVSPSGDDGSPGTLAKPFATPGRAVEAVRALVAGGLKEDVRVTFAAGTYELAAPLVFTPADSGTAAHSITYAAAPHQT